jgi:hypothetical protein
LGLAATTGIAFLLLLGAEVGFFVLRGVSEAGVAVFLSFGAAALLYLIAEELLVESIEGESLFSVATGFFMVLAFKPCRRALKPRLEPRQFLPLSSLSFSWLRYRFKLLRGE